MRASLSALVGWIFLVFAHLAMSGAIRAQAPEDPDKLNREFGRLHRAGDPRSATEFAEHALAVAERVRGADHPDIANALRNLGLAYKTQGRYADAEQSYRRSLAMTETIHGPDHEDIAIVTNNLAELYRELGRYAEAEPLYKRSLVIREKTKGVDDLFVATALSNLALLYDLQGRDTEAEASFKRAIQIRERVLSADDPSLEPPLHGLAHHYVKLRRYGEAEPLYLRARVIVEKAYGPDHPDVRVVLGNLAELYRAQHRYAEAEPLFLRAMTIAEATYGPNHADVGILANNIAVFYASQRRYADAEPFYTRSLAITQASLGPDHPAVATALANLAALHFLQSDWATATVYGRQATDIRIRRARRGAGTFGGTSNAKSEFELWRNDFQGLLKAASRVAEMDKARSVPLIVEMFHTAQWIQISEAASSLAQMAARYGTGGDVLAGYVRERQDLVHEWQRRDKALTSVRLSPAPKRDANAEAAAAARMMAIDTRIAEIDRTLAKDFPEYAGLVGAEPLSVADVQALLGPDEAVLLFVTTTRWPPIPEETLLWVITKTGGRWMRLGLGPQGLGEYVAALRCGLDTAAWNGETVCGKLLNLPAERFPKDDEPLPFNLEVAHALYVELLGNVLDLIKDKHLLIVPSGPLTQLPFQVLVTEKPDATLSGMEAFRHAAWLARRNAVTVLPSVSSLKALRQQAKVSRANKPYIGFGNPLLDGPDERYRPLAMAARDKQRCLEKIRQRMAGLFGLRAGLAPRAQRGGSVDVEDVRAQVPLPETADELCAVARALAVPASEIRLGAGATEATVKSLNEKRELAQYRIVHFATHGALAGQIGDDSEPGLILTPPSAATAEDDGYLSASEIAGLKLDADWVILSACNTAAGGSDKAEALSGLARAFFYAGTRALLVSHWAVYSDSTAKLITNVLRTMAADKAIGRSEALRRSMLVLIDAGKPNEAHPSYWAPFVVVGEGAH